MDNILSFPKRKTAVEKESASKIERLEGLLGYARKEIEDMLPMTTAQRMRLLLLFESVLDCFEKESCEPPDRPPAA